MRTRPDPDLPPPARDLAAVDALTRHVVQPLADDEISALIRTRSGHTPIRALSGGNQQKVLLEKWVQTRPAVLLLDDVTRGVDISTKHQIYELVRALAQQGVGIIFYSSDTNELIGLADRVLVMAEGEVRRSLAGDDLSAAAIVDIAFGARADS